VSAEYYRAESENGEVVEDPSEDSLYMRVSDLREPDNTYLVIEPSDERFDWHVVIALHPEGGYELELRNPSRQEHSVTHETDRSKLCRNVTIWAAAALRH